VIKVQDIKAIAKYGIMVTPAMVVEGVVRVVGKVLKTEEIKKLIQ